MARYRVQGPDGAIHVFEGPDGASPAQVEAFAAQTFGGREQRIAELKRTNPGEYDPTSPEWQAKYGPTSGMSGLQKFAAGYGSAIPSMMRGTRQLLGLASQEEIDEAKRLEAPLMATGTGLAGSIAGNVAAAIPTVAIPGAASLRGATAIGAGTGLLQPVASDESRLKNIAIGGLAGGGGVALGRGIRAGVQGARALIEPFTEGGRQAIAGRTLQRFGIDAGDLAGVTSAPTATGARQTLAEQIARPEAAAGAARLQDAVRALDPELAGRFAAREAESNAARIGALRELAGEGGQREFFAASRDAAARDLYGKAFQAPLDYGALTRGEKGEITKLLKLPALREAAQSARDTSANMGINISSPQGSVQGLHMMKLALDDAIANTGTSAAQVNKAAGLTAARDRLVTFIERMSPDYAEARSTYAAMSRPLNQMDTAAELLRRGTSATSDLAGNPRLMPDALARAARDEGRLIKQATGRQPAAALSDLMEPAQLAQLRAVLGESDRAAAVARAAQGPGSATAQRLASQNVLRQLLGPTGLPQSWAESTLLNTAMRPVQFAYGGVAEPRLQGLLADIALDPALAQAALRAATPAQRGILAGLLSGAGRGALSPQVTSSAALAGNFP